MGNGRPVERVEPEYQEPLILSSVLDEASQRFFLVALFVFIQSWKIYDVILIKSDSTFDNVSLTSLDNFSFVVKYALCDGVFFWMLPILNIQYLRFSLFKTLALTLIMNGFTFFLVSDFTIPILTSVVLPIWNQIFQKRELTITGDSVRLNNIIDINSHFKGKLTINYLPDSSAKFNPFHFDQICLDGNTLQMPIEFNTTTSIGHLQIEHTTTNNKVRHIDFRGGRLNKLLKKDYSYLSKHKDYKKIDPIFYIEVPIIEPGMYKISKVVDNKNNPIRTYKSEFLISSCPKAQFVYPKTFDLAKNYKCIGNADDNDYNLPFLESFGVLPLNALVQLKISGNKYKTFNVTYSEEDPIVGLSWLQTKSTTRNSLEQEILLHPEILDQIDDGSIEFQLLSVTDYLGNTRRYNLVSKDKDVWFSYDIKRAPVLGLTDQDPNNAELITGGSKYLTVLGIEKLNENDFPLNIVIAHSDNNGSTSEFTKVLRKPSDVLRGIEIKNPGSYQLVRGTSHFCFCQIDTKDTVSVIPAPPPELGLIANPIVDKCLGTTGYKFDFSLIGKAPFQIDYKVYQNQTNGILRPVHNHHGTTTRHIKTLSKDYTFNYKPPGEGNYLIKFSTLKDANNPAGIDLDTAKYTYQTYFKQVSTVSFHDKGSGQKLIKMCHGESRKVPLHFTGNGPFSFKYDFIDSKTGQKLVDTISVNEVSEHEITIPANLKSSRFEVKIHEVVDKFSCAAIIDKLEKLIIQGQLEIPEAELDITTAHHQIVEGDSVEIPIKIKFATANSIRDKIGYRITSLTDPTKFSIRSISNKAINAREEGIYSLEKFENDGCPGVVVNQKHNVKITYLPKPKLSVSGENSLRQHLTEKEIHLAPVCQNFDQTVNLKLEGKLPFVVEYEIRLPNDKVENRLMNVEKNEITINLPTNLSGKYVHTFKQVYDQLYNRSKRRPSLPDPQTVQYNVHESPNGLFTTDNLLQICENRIVKAEDVVAAQVPIKLTGAAPFTIKASLWHEKLEKSEKLDFYVSEGLLQLYYSKNIGLGEHILTIDEITDLNGCKKSGFDKSNNFVLLVTEVPNIQKSTEHYDICVGDYVSYNMTGIAPFTVFYNFRGKKQRASLESKFVRLAAKPGKLYIEGLQDSSANQCLVNFNENEKLTMEVHDLPSVEVQKGDFIIEDIHEGDQTELRFTFQGVPPFKVTYVRTMGEKVLEKHTIEDIWGYDHVVKASLAGTYEAIVVEDKYCRAKKT